ncbi:MAG: hypothetical protein Fues2KO_29350 [Fuerstiella sp.]
MSLDPLFESQANVAAKVLSQHFGTSVEITRIDRLSGPLRRNLVLRCHLSNGSSELPATVMLKQAAQRRYEPDDAQSRAAVGLFRDWAGLQFLNATPGCETVAPRFFGGDRDAGILLLEDLGAGRDLDDLLMCGSADEARRGLIQLAETLGRMHASTAGREQSYVELRNSLGPGDQTHRLRMGGRVIRYLNEFQQHCLELDVPVDASFFDDVSHITRSIADPDDFLSYTHTDACPDNCLFVDGELRLIDFEFGGFRHALLDAVYGWIRFPTCWCVRDIPDDVIEQMEAAYRPHLAAVCPSARDDGLYFEAVADACGFWLLQSLAHLLHRSMQYSEPQGTSTNRQRLLIRLSAFLQVAERSGHLSAMQRVMQSLQQRLRDRWPEEPIVYDGFLISERPKAEEVELFCRAIEQNAITQTVSQLKSHPALALGRAPDEDQTPVLFLAVRANSPPLVERLLQSGADPRLTSRSGWTVLAAACAGGSTEIVELLLNAGLDINERDAWGTLPIYAAADSPAMLRFLLSRGAQADLKLALDLQRMDVAERIAAEHPEQVHFRYGTGLTLLHDAAARGTSHLPAVHFLLERGIDLNARTNWQATALHLAAFHGHDQTCRILIEHGADTDLRDRQNLTARRIAELKQHQQCIAVLDSLSTTDSVVEETSLATLDSFYSSVGRLRQELDHPLDDVDS